MANYTSNYNLTKPASTDLYDVEVSNSNMDKIDAALVSVKDGAFPRGGSYNGDMNELGTPGQYRLQQNANLPAKGYYGQCFVGKGYAGSDTMSQLVISYIYNRMFFRGAQLVNGVWKWEEWSEVYSTLNKPTFNAVSWLGLNPITTPETDTTEAWIQKGSGFAQFSGENQITDQPSRYGFLETRTYTSDVFQTWRCLPNGPTYQRSGNLSGWSGTWTKMYDSKNPPSITDIGIVVSDVEPTHKAGQLWLQPIS